jgi:CRISPR-associated endonuclease/helicase Cas3
MKNDHFAHTLTGKPPFAHTLTGKPPEEWQPLEEHLKNVAKRAAMHADAFESGEWGALAGHWHDLGKYAEDFQDKLLASFVDPDIIDASVLDERAAGKRVDHSTAGAVLVYERCAGKLSGAKKDELPAAAAALAMVIAGHHAGLPERKGFEAERLTKPEKQALLERAKTDGAPAHLTTREVPDSPPFLWPEAFQRFADKNARSRSFALRQDLWTRMLFSALIDADRLDTEAFIDSKQAEVREEAKLGPEVLPNLKTALDAHLERLACDAVGRITDDRPLARELNNLRVKVLAACRAAANRPAGKHSLTVPTGGGKTLASLAFALGHALENKRRRVIVVLPFTSIIDQTASVYRDVFGEALKGALVEHHSNLDPKWDTHENRLASENWDAPVVVTTSVQFFESLFACKGTAARKIHNIAKSVVIFDEVQTLPHHLREPIFDVLNQLVDHYGVSMLLCTATQPALDLEKVDRQDFPHLAGVKEVMPDIASTFAKVAGRVVAEFPPDDSPTTWEELAVRVAKDDRALVIVQRRDDARDLCRLLPEGTLHLSALMCAAHRREVLAKITRILKETNEPCRVVATTLVEAGIDLDFPVVYRDLGGVDAMAQAAGRCNREGRLDTPGRLILFKAPSEPPKGLQRGQEITRTLRKAGALDLFDPDSYQRYFRLYLSGVGIGEPVTLARTNRDFPKVADLFRMIDDGGQVPVVVPYGDSPERVRTYEIAPGRQTLRALQPYIVTVPRDAFAMLVKTNQIRAINEHVNVLVPNDPEQ